jgi:hypothetical protein
MARPQCDTHTLLLIYPDINLIAFISKYLGAEQEAQNAQTWPPKVFLAMTPTVKRAKDCVFPGNCCQ